MLLGLGSNEDLAVGSCSYDESFLQDFYIYYFILKGN